MDERIKTRIILFYIGGILNAMFGLYVLFEGSSFLPPDQVQMLGLVFLVFTVVNFYMASYLKKKVQAHLAAAQRAKNDDRSPAS
jgi:membrane protein implicated in regulation of membrane protease activity